MTQNDRGLPPEWATDATYNDPGYDWHGDPLIVEPSAAIKGQGWTPRDKPPAEWRNWLGNRAYRFLNWLHSMHVTRFWEADFSAVTPGTDWSINPGTFQPPCDVVYDEVMKHFCALDYAGYTITTLDPGYQPAGFTSGGGGLLWVPDANVPNVSADWITNNAGEITHYTGNVRVVTQVGITAGIVLASTAFGVWASIATPTAAAWKCCASDHGTPPSTCVAGLVGGNTALDHFLFGVGWAARAPGTGTEQMRSLKHNHLNGSLYKWVGLTNTYRTISSDAVTWSAAAHGLTPAPRDNCLAYNENPSRWITVLSGANGDIAVSDDNGATWTKKAGVLGALSNVGVVHTRIACDRNGCWLITNTDSLQTGGLWFDTEWFASVDNGDTWHRVWCRDMATRCAAGPCWGDDEMVVVGNLGAVYGPRLI